MDRTPIPATPADPDDPSSPETTARYRPAYELADENLERAGRAL